MAQPFGAAWRVASVFAAVAFPGAAFGESGPELRVWRDEGGLPRCVWAGQEWAGAEGDSRGRGLVFRWSKRERYHRKIEAARIEADRLEDDRDLERTSGGRDSGPDCSDWRELATRPELDWRPVPENPDSFLGYPISPELRTGLEQARRGANELHQPDGAAAWLRQNPLERFDLRTSRELTRRFGMGFVSELYHHWLMSKPRNAALEREMSAGVGRELSSLREAVARVYADTRFAVASGIGNDPRRGRMKVIVEDLQSLGLEVEVLLSTPYGTVAQNSDSLVEQLDGLARDGKSLVVIGSSKSAPEVLGALARMQRPAAVRGCLMLSGLFSGSFLADSVLRIPLFEPLDWLTGVLGQWAGGVYRSPILRSFASASTLSLERWYGDFVPRLPKGAVYLNLVGTVPGDGLGQDPMIVKLQNGVIRPLLPHAGANDGYVEYPGTAMPEEWGLDSYELAIWASHPLSDGQWNGVSMASQDARRRFFASALLAMRTRSPEPARFVGGGTVSP